MTITSLNWQKHQSLPNTQFALQDGVLVMLHHNAWFRPLVWTVWSPEQSVTMYGKRDEAEAGALRLMNVLLAHNGETANGKILGRPKKAHPTATR